MNFPEAEHYLLSLGHETLTMKLGLNGTRRLLHELGDPHKSFYKIQIAGTNGKGSTAAMLDAIASASGIRTGLYTSPHLVSITERIRTGGADISPEAFTHATNLVRDAAARLTVSGSSLPTFFEQITAVACVAFREAGVNLAILETGLGGRLDSVTATRPALIAITPIALDHQEYLGATVTEIAREKAAVMRSGTRAVIAPQTAEARRAIAGHAREINVDPLYLDAQNARITHVDERGHLTADIITKRRMHPELFVNLAGRHQLTNAQVAVELADVLRAESFAITDNAIRCGLNSTRHAGRLEWHTPSLPSAPPFLFDGAHNVAGAHALSNYLREFVPEPVTIIFGAMRDKDLNEIAASLFPLASHLILTQPDNPRAAHVDSLRDIALAHKTASHITVCPHVKESLRVAQYLTARSGVVCVTGSLYLIGEVKMQLTGCDNS